MGPRYEHFKFEVGAFVQAKILGDARHHHRKMQIVERLYQECPGGVQLHYGCRCSGLIGSVCRFLEIEIEPYVPDGPAKDWESSVEELIALKKSRTAVREAIKEVTETDPQQ